MVRLRQRNWDEWKRHLEKLIVYAIVEYESEVRRLKKWDDEGGPKGRNARKSYKWFEKRRDKAAENVEKEKEELRIWLENNPRPELE